MSKVKRLRPSPAFVLAMIALIVAMAGAAYALERNSVRSKHIVNGQVKYKDTQKGIAVRAYALVTGDGAVDETHSRGIRDQNIDTFGGGFCIENLPFTPRFIVATHRYTSGGSDELTAEVPAPAGFCDGTRTAWVHIGNNLGPDFYVALYQ
jgi:hypothetical protein